MSNIFKLNFRDLAGAFVSAVLVAGIGAILDAGDIFSLNFKELINISVLAGLGSLLKSFSTNDYGEFLGGIKIK